MRNFAVFGAVGASPTPEHACTTIDGMTVRHAIVDTSPPEFDPDAAAAAQRVLVRVRAFSCNYRDRGFLLRLQKAPAHQFFVIGSEFVGTVVAVGRGVTSVRTGDRVIGQNHYTGEARALEAGVAGGLPTNNASKEFLILPEAKVVAVPSAMPDEEAAAFSVGAQTAYGMIRRLAPVPGSRVLVTSASSATSLAILGALHPLQLDVYASTSSPAFDDRFRQFGVARVVHTGEAPGAFREGAVVDALAREIGGFDYVFDPFFDLHLEKAVACLAPGGTYGTCGLAAQTPGAAQRGGVQRLNAEAVMTTAVVKNLTLVGNCLGLRDDLGRALSDYAAGRFRCVLDSVLQGEQTGAFLTRTFVDRRRFGKVVFRYD